MPSPVDRRDRRDAVELVRGDVALGPDDDARALEQVGLVVAELAQQDLELVARAPAARLREVEQDAQHPGALDVAQEVVAESASLGRALDQSGDVGHDELGGVARAPGARAHAHHAQVAAPAS